MKILIIEPGRRPRPKEISGTVESMRAVVGGELQAVYPEDNAALVYNEGGAALQLPLNREIPDSDGNLTDIVRGTFFICGAPEDCNHFTSLTEEQVQKYSRLFATPQTFLNLGGRTIALPCGEAADHQESKPHDLSKERC